MVLIILCNVIWIVRYNYRYTDWAATRDFQKCGIFTSVDSDEPLQPPFRLRNSKWCSVSSLTIIAYSSDLHRLWSDCAYAQTDLRLCWSHIPNCWKSHALAQLSVFLVSITHCLESMPDIFFFGLFFAWTITVGAGFHINLHAGIWCYFIGGLSVYCYYNYIFLGTLFFLVVCVCVIFFNKYKTQIKMKKVCISHLRIKWAIMITLCPLCILFLGLYVACQ